MIEEDEFDKLEGSHETSFRQHPVPDARIPKEWFFQKKHQPLLDSFHLATPFGIIQPFVDPLLPEFFLAWQEGDCHGYRNHHIPF